MRNYYTAAWARRACADKPVILISGNHEFYGEHWERCLDIQREQALRHDVYFLENDSITLGGVQFLGYTLWTDFEYFGAEQAPLAVQKARHMMTNYRKIMG